MIQEDKTGFSEVVVELGQDRGQGRLARSFACTAFRNFLLENSQRARHLIAHPSSSSHFHHLEISIDTPPLHDWVP